MHTILWLVYVLPFRFISIKETKRKCLMIECLPHGRRTHCWNCLKHLTPVEALRATFCDLIVVPNPLARKKPIC